MSNKKIMADFKLLKLNLEDTISRLNKSTVSLGLSRAFKELERIQDESRWREDPLNLMPLLRLEGLRLEIADNLEKLAEVLRGGICNEFEHRDR